MLPGRRPVVERLDDAAEILALLVALARDQHHVTGLGEADRALDRGAPVWVDLDARAGALKDVLDDGERALGAWVVGGHDRDVRELGRDASHERTFAAVAVATGPEHHEHPPLGEVPRRAERRLEGVRRVGIVDEHGERLAVVDAFEAAGHGVDARDALHDRVLVEIEEQSRRHGAERVRDVEDPGEGTSKSIPAARNVLPLGVSSRSSARISARSPSPKVTSGARCTSASDSASRPPHSPSTLTAAGGGCALAKSGLFARKYSSIVPCRSRWSWRQVREHERIEPDAIEPPERRPVRRRLERDAAVAGVEHLAEEPLEVDCLRGRERRGAFSPPILHSTVPQAGVPPGRLEHRVQQERGRRLPVRPRHAHDLELLRRLAEEGVRGDRHRCPAVGDDELRASHVELALDDQRGRAPLERFPRKVVAVDPGAADAEEQGAGHDIPRVVGEVADLDRLGSGHLARPDLRRGERADQRLELHRPRKASHEPAVASGLGRVAGRGLGVRPAAPRGAGG